MTTQPKPIRLTADRFIAWAAEQPRGRFELWSGEVVAMAPERAAHIRAKLDVAIALRSAIAAAGLGCEALTDGMSVRIDEATVYEPDALVRCGPRVPGDAIETSDPVIVVEVVSPSSRGIDSGAKLMGYFRLPSVRHYLVLDTETRAVAYHHRVESGEIATGILRDGRLRLDPPGIVLDVKELFATV